MSMKADVQLDAKGLACPMPIVKTKKVMNTLTDGQIIEVQATDKGSKADLIAWAEKVGHQYIGTLEKDEVLFHYIRKCSDDEVEEKTFEQTLTNEEAINLAKTSGVILDVREETEYAFGHLEGAKSIPMGDLDARIKELDTAAPVYVICRTGKRSDLAAHKLAAAGFTNVYNVIPGMSAWQGPLSKNV